MSSTLDSLSRRDDARTPHRRIPAWLLPLAIVAGFLLIFLALFRDRLLPARTVDVAVVLATPAIAGTSAPPAETVATPAEAGRMLFQASGWIEPDPLPFKASALIDGVIDTVQVLEGQPVEKGQALATLVDADARIALKMAEQEHQRLVSSHASHMGAITTVRKKLISAQSAVEAAQAMEDEAEDQYRRLNLLRERAISQGEVTSARLRLVRNKAEKAMADAGVDELEADIARLELETAVKTDEIGAAALQIEKAKLELERTRIVSPITGRVLRLLAIPGQKRMLGMDDENSSSIAILYDPAKLQVRVDVPIADAAGLKVGQNVRIHCGLLPDRQFQGEVTRISGEADLQRNTLQAKVRIVDPVEELRPEMLCRAEFLAPSQGALAAASSAGPGPGPLATWVPEAAILANAVWVCDPRTKRVASRPVQPTPESRDGYRRVNDALGPGEWVVLRPQGLRDGQRVNPTLVEP